MVRKVTAQSLLDALGVLDTNILAEAARMAILFAKAARYRVDAMRTRSRAEADLEQWAATLNLRYRARATGKPTEAYFKAKIALNSRYQKLSARKESCVHREELAKLILDAYRMRRDAIKIIADHRGFEAYSAERMTEQDVQTRLLRATARKLVRRRGHT